MTTRDGQRPRRDRMWPGVAWTLAIAFGIVAFGIACLVASTL